MTECNCFRRRANFHLFFGFGVMLIGGLVGIATHDVATHQVGLVISCLGVVLMIISAMAIHGDRTHSRLRESQVSCEIDTTIDPAFIEKLMKVEPRKPRPFFLVTATLQDGDILKGADGQLFVPVYHDGQLRGEPFAPFTEVHLESVAMIRRAEEMQIGELCEELISGLAFETVEDQIDKRADNLFREYMKTNPTMDRVFVTAFHHPDELLIGLTVGNHPVRPITNPEELDAIRTLINNTVQHHSV